MVIKNKDFKSLLAVGVGATPTTPEELEQFLDCWVDGNQSMTKEEAKQRKLENLILEVRNGVPLTIKQKTITPKKSPSYILYYARKPHGDNKIQKRTKYEVMKEWYSEYTGYEFEENVKGPRTLAQLADEFIKHLQAQYIDVPNPAKAQKPQTITRKQRDLTAYIVNTDVGKLHFRSMKPIELEEALMQVVDTMHPKAKRFTQIMGYMDAKKTESLFDYAIYQGYINENPMHRVNKNAIIAHCQPDEKHVKKKTVLTIDQYRQYCSLVTQKRIAQRTYAPMYAVEFGMYTGARIGEIVALKWSDVDWNKKYIKIERSEHREDRPDGTREWTIGKTKSINSNRIIPMTAQLEDLLKELRQNIPTNADDFIFVNKDGERIRQTTVSNALEELNKKKVFPMRLSQHFIRKTVSSIMHHESLSTETISSLLGHDPLTNREFYSFDVSDNAEKLAILTRVATA